MLVCSVDSVEKPLSLLLESVSPVLTSLVREDTFLSFLHIIKSVVRKEETGKNHSSSPYKPFVLA